MCQDFREAVRSTVGDQGEPALDDERLREILNELPDVYTLHRTILTELENRIQHWWAMGQHTLLLNRKYFNTHTHLKHIKLLLKKKILSNLFLPLLCCSESNLRAVGTSLSWSRLCLFIQGGQPNNCRYIPEQESRVFGLYHVHRPLRSEHEFTGGQLPNVARFCGDCSTFWGMTYDRVF